MKENSALVPTVPQQLAVRHAWLVERGVRSLPILGIAESRVGELCSALWDWDFDIRARALETIADLGPLMRSRRHQLDSLIFAVADSIYEWYGPHAVVGCRAQLYLPGLFSGRHYPPGAEYFELLCRALESLVGPVQGADEAIMDVTYYGTTDSRIRAVEWLADHTITSTTHQTFSDYLYLSLISTTQKMPLLLALKYADAAINDRVDGSVCFFADEIILRDTPVGLKTLARRYLLRLHSRASQEALVHAFRAMAESRDHEDTECASEMFYEVMSRDLDEYSDADLEMICRFKGWPSDEQDEVDGEQDEVDEDKERVMEELERRGLRG